MILDDCGMALVRCSHCRRTREALDEDDVGPWTCDEHGYLDEPPTDEGWERTGNAYERDLFRERG